MSTVSRHKVVTLGDATLDTEDLALLVPPAWMNDALISFWLEHLRLHVVKCVHHVIILPPNVSFFLALCHDETDERQLLRDLKLHQRNLVLVTVNDSCDLDFSSSSGPSDSLPTGSGNERAANNLTAKLRRLMTVQNAKFVSLNVPLQHNGYDCGAYLCVFAEHVILNFNRNKKLANLYSNQNRFSAADVEQKRQDIGKLACRLLDQQQKESKKSKHT